MVFILVLTHGWSAMANAASTSHDPVRWSGHANARLLASLSAGHEHVIGHLKAGHGHDHAADAEHQDHEPGHHGHHSPDHSHDSPNLPQVAFLPSLNTVDLWQVSYRASDPPLRAFRLERPPKHQPNA